MAGSARVVKTTRYSPTPRVHVRDSEAERVVLDVTNLDVRKKAFFSGTDDNDDRGNCYISGVVGKLSTTCDMVFRFNLPGNVKINPLPLDFFFEEEPKEVVEVPEAWLGQVKREVYTPPVYQGSYRGHGRGGNYSQNTGGVASNVVANKSFRGGNGGVGLESMGLSADDTEVLNQFGYPFPYSGEEGSDSFPPRLLTQGRQKKSASNKRSGKKIVPAETRFPRK